MEDIIYRISEDLCSIVTTDIIKSEDLSIPENMNDENITIIYPTLTKDFHYIDYKGCRIKHNPDIFNIEEVGNCIIESIPLAKVYKSQIYLLFSSNGDSDILIKKVLEHTIPIAEEYTKQAVIQNFKKAFTDGVEAKVNEYKNNINENERDAKDKEQELLNLHRRIVLDKMALKHLDGPAMEWKSKAEKEYDHLMKLIPNLYKTIKAEEGDLKAWTHEVTINYNHNSYHIGEFEVAINLATGNLTITNLTNPIDGYDHPHINDGASCLGNIGNGVIRMIAEFELFGALQMIHTFLHSYNSSSPYLKIQHWDPNYEDEENERYERCREENSGYACVECGDENCPNLDHAYVQCLEDSTLEECRDCTYQCHIGRERIEEAENE